MKKMKKKLFLASIVCLLGLCANAQRSEGGFKSEVNVGYIKAFESLGNNAVSLEAIGGYQFTPHVFAGAGVGGMYVTGDEKDFRLPVFADFRYDVLENSLSPFAEAQIGYNVGFGEQESGFHFNPQLGLRLSLNDRIGANLSIGYLMLTSGGAVGSGMSFKLGIDF